MPFPNQEIEEAYQKSVPIVQGCFREDPDVLEIGGLVQKHYMEIQKRVDADTLCWVNGLNQLMQEMQEYQCRHGFVEGWKMAQEQWTSGS